MNRNVVGIIGSIAVHLIFVLAFLLTPQPPPPPEKQIPDSGENPINVTLLMNEEGMSKGTEFKQVYTFDGDPCPPNAKTYLGVGISYDRITGEIEQAPSVHPAYKAGIRVGDLLVNDPYPDEQGMMYLNIIQNNHQQTLAIKATQICYLSEPLT